MALHFFSFRVAPLSIPSRLKSETSLTVGALRYYDRMLPDKLFAAAIAHRMFLRGDLAVVGVSGGLDSVALLHALTGLAARLGISLRVAHLDHQLRPSSAEDAQYVCELATRLGWPSTTGRHDVRELAARKHLSIEEAGRAARYSFFASVVRQAGAASVVVAHTASDQVETVVLHWLRGCGTSGIRGLRPITYLTLSHDDNALARGQLPRDPTPEESDSSIDTINDDARPTIALRVVRPLLDVTRGEVQDYCGALGLQAREDASNRDLSFVRNRVRWQLLPELRRFNSKFDGAVLRASRIAANDDDYLEQQAMVIWPRVVSEHDQRLVYNLEEWKALPSSLQYRLLRNGIAKLQGNLFDVSMVHLDTAVRLANRNRAGATVHLPRGLRLARRYSDFVLYGERFPSERALALSSEGEHLNVPGATFIAGSGFKVIAEITEKCDLPKCAGDLWRACLDAAAVGPSLRVRKRQPGDRFQPSGMHREKKLQDFFVDSKVPRAQREDVPVVIGADGRIVWVVGCRVAEWAKVTPVTRQVLDLTFERLDIIE